MFQTVLSLQYQFKEFYLCPILFYLYNINSKSFICVPYCFISTISIQRVLSVSVTVCTFDESVLSVAQSVYTSTISVFLCLKQFFTFKIFYKRVLPVSQTVYTPTISVKRVLCSKLCIPLQYQMREFYLCPKLFIPLQYQMREFYLCPKLFIPLQYQMREFCLCPEQNTCCHTYPRQSYVRQNLYFQSQHPKFWNHSIFRKRNCLVEKLTNGVAAEQYPGSFSAASSTHVAHQPSFHKNKKLYLKENKIFRN